MGRDRSPEQVPDQVGDWNKRRGREAPPLVVFGARAGPRSGAGTEIKRAGMTVLERCLAVLEEYLKTHGTFETVSAGIFLVFWRGLGAFWG